MDGRGMTMTDFVIEVSMAWHSDAGPVWKLFNRTDTLEQAREIAAKAILKTNYLAVRIRQKS